MSFRKSIFAITATAFAWDAKCFATYICTFNKVSEDVHKK